MLSNPFATLHFLATRMGPKILIQTIQFFYRPIKPQDV